MSKHLYTWFTCCLFALLTALPMSVNAQQTITLSDNVEQTLTPGTTYTFYDSGGADGDYATNESYTAVFTNSGDITINFSSLTTEGSSSCSNWDYMLIYDGDVSTGTLLGRGQTSCSSSISLNQDYVATSGTMTVVWQSDGSTTAAGWVATITAGAAQTCPRPKSLAVSDITNNSATLTWKAGGSETQWEVVIGDNAPVFATDTFVALTGLTAVTTYGVSLRAICGAGDTSGVVTTSFKTLQVPANLPYSTGFEASDDNASWSILSGASTNKWAFGSATNNGGSNALYISDNNGTSNTYSVVSSASSVSLAYRLLHFEEAGDYNIGFDWKNKGESADIMGVFLIPSTVDMESAKITLGYTGTAVLDGMTLSNTSPYATSAQANGWITLLNPLGTSTSYSQFYGKEDWTHFASSLHLSEVKDYYLLFFWRNSTSTQNNPPAAVDNLLIKMKACADVSGIKVFGIAGTTANVSWNAIGGAAGYEYVVLPDTAAFDATGKAAITDTVATITGLTANTSYKVYVRSSCGDGENAKGDWIEGGSFTTKCDPIATLPWTESFERSASGTGVLPECWSYVQANGNYPYVYNTTYSSYEGSQCLYFYGGAVTSSANSEQIVALPGFSADLSNARIRFYYKSTVGASYGHLSLGKVTDLDNPSTFVEILPLEQTGSYVEVEQALASVGNAYIAFKFAGGTSTTSAYIDTIIVDLIPSCFPVSNVIVADVKTDNALIRWTDDSRNTAAAKYRVSVMNGEVAMVTDTIVTAAQMRLKGLTPATSYTGLQVSIVRLCGETDESEVYTELISLNTNCEAISELPWTENFEALAKGSSTASAPLCWDLAMANDGTYPYIYVNNSSSYVHSGSQSLYFQSSSSRSGFVILPVFESSLLEGAELMFYYKHESASSSGVPTVGYMTDVTDTATFVAIQSLPRSTTWQEADVELPTIPAGARLAIRYGKQSQNYYMGIDDIVVRKVPTCIAPVSVSVIDSLITTTSATIQWSDAAGEAGNYLVTVKKDNAIFNGYENVAVNGDTTFVINGLENSTTYSLSVSIVKVCASANSYPLESTLSFATACDLFTNLPLIEDFESYTATTYAEAGILPACWTGYSVPSSSTTTTYVPHVIGSGSYWYTQSGTKSLSFYGRGDNYVALPEFAAALNTLQLSFWYRFESASYGTLTVGYITANDADFNTFTAIETVPAHAGTMIEYEKSLENIPAEAVRLAIHFNAGVYACCIDDVVVEKIPTCPKPSNVTLSALTATSASFTWTSGESAASYSVEVYDGATRLDSAVIAASELPYVIDTLQPNTDYAYTFKVYAMCGAADGNSRAVVSEIEIHTPCPLIPETDDPFSYSENFDNAASGSGKLPDCWTYAQSYGTSTIYPYVYSSTSAYAYSGTKCLYFYGGTSTSEEIVALPGIETPLSTLRIFLRYKNASSSSSYTGSSYASLTVGVMSNPSDPSTFVPVKTLAKEANYVQEEVMLSIAPADCHYVALRYAGGTSFGYTMVDDIEIMPLPACPQPAVISVDYVAQDAANVSWTPSGSETLWGVSLYKGTVLDRYYQASAANLALSNLDEKTTYTIEVRALCSATDSSEVVTASFRTTGEIASALNYSTGFENDTENAKWTIVNGSNAANKWTIGNGAHNGGANALYVSKDASGTHGYVHTKSASIAYRTFHFDAEDYVINFDWIGHGEGGYDGMIALLIPTTVDLDGASLVDNTINAGGVSVTMSAPVTTAATAPFTADGWLPLINPLTPTVKYSRFDLVDEWETDTKIEFSFDAPGNYNLAFIWLNDGTSGSEPSAAVDNLVVAKKLCGDITGIHQTAAMIDGATLAWSPTESVVRYEYVVLAEGEELNEEDAASVADTIVTVSGLNHSSYYTIAVRAICSEGAGMWTRAIFHTDCDVMPNEGELFIGFEQYPAGINLQKDALCWDTICPNGSVNAGWTISSVAHEGSKSVSIANVGANKSSVLVSPQFEFYYGYELVAFVKEGTSHSDADSVIFYINDAPTLEGAARIGSVANLSSDWTQFSEKLPTEWFVDPTIDDEYAEPYEYAYILVQAYAANTIYIDDVLLHEAPQCPAAKNIRIDAVSDRSITVVWDAAEGQNSWIAQYQVKGAGVQGTPEINGEPVLVIDNLPANTLDTLIISIESYCGEEASEELADATIAFRTECGAIESLPWTEGFENMSLGSSSSAAPECWSLASANDGTYPYIYVNNSTSYVHTGSKSLYFQSSNARSGFAILPAFADGLLEGAELNFFYKHESTSSSGVPTVGYLTDISDTTTFVAIQILTRSTSWKEANVQLPTLPSGARLAIRYGKQTQNYYMGIDDIKVRKIPTCYAPDAVSVKNVTATTATLVWNAMGENVTYSVSVNNETPVLVQDTTFVIEYLEAATSYTLPVVITTVCSESDFSEDYETSVVFTTNCVPQSTLPWSEDFEGLVSGIPNCWNNEEGTTTSATYRWNYYATGHEGKCVRFNSYLNTNGLTNVLATPEIVLPAEPAELVFWCMNPTGGDFNVSISAGGGARQVLLSGLTGISSWTQKNVDLTAYAGQTIQIFFNATSNYANGDAYVYLDDVVVEAQPSCKKPSAVELVASDDASASFSWSGTADSYVVEVYNGTNRIDSVEVAAASLPYVIDTLQANSDYAFRFVVYSLCGGSDRSQAVSSLVNVHTLCSAIAIDGSWVETFDNLTAGIPDCWNNEEGTVTTASYKWNMYATGYEGKCVRFNSYNNSNGLKNVLATPMLTLPEAASQLEFMYKNPDGGDFTVSIAVNGRRDTLASDLTDVDTWTLAKFMLADYAGETIQILFNGTSNWANDDAYIYVDNVSISPAPTCMPVKNIDKLSLTSNEVVFTWESNGNESAWNVVVTDLLNENAELFNNTVSSPNVSVALEANTKYSLRVSVAANCGDGDIAEAVSRDFTFRSPMAESMIQAIENTEEYTFDLSSADEQANWALFGAEETNHFIFASFNNNAGLYISHNDTEWHYETDDAASAAIAIRAFSVPEDNTPIKVSFKWEAKGETSYGSAYDFGRAFIASADAEVDVVEHEAVINGTIVAGSNALTGVYSITDNNVAKLNDVTEEQQLTDEGAILDAGSYLIVFMWKNDDISGNQNPLGVYDLKIRNMKGVGPITHISDMTIDGVEAIKFIRDGQVYILRDGVVYTILGTTVR